MRVVLLFLYARKKIGGTEDQNVGRGQIGYLTKGSVFTEGVQRKG